MSNGVVGSRSPYIIICNGRIAVALASNGFEMIRAASQTATNLVIYYGDKLSYADTNPISDLQHEMMSLVDGSRGKSLKSADETVDEMFALLDALENKFQ